MKTLINISHIVPNAAGKVQKRRVSLGGRLLTPGAHTTFEQIPQEAIALVYHELHNPGGFLRVVEAPAISSASASEVDPAEIPAANTQAISAELSSPTDQAGPNPEAEEGNEDALDDDEAGDNDDGEVEDARDAVEDAISTAGTSATSGARSASPDAATKDDGKLAKDLSAGQATSRIAELKSVEAIDVFVEGDHRASVLKAVERHRAQLASAE